MAVLNNSNAISAGGYDINNSLRFRSSASAFLSRTPSVSGNRRTWTWSAWVKRGSLGSAQVLFGAGLNNDTNADELVSISFTANDQLQHYVVETGVTDRNNTSTAVYRDPSAWYHIVAIYDSTQATASNRQRLFVNGVEITAWSSTSYVNQNYQPSVNSSSYPHAIGKYGFNNTRYFDGYMADINFIDGQALTPSSFGQTDLVTGVWQPKAYTGTYGTNGFYLKFADASAATAAAIGKDSSGNGNNWTPNNISVTSGTTYDAMTDSPTNTSVTVGNYATFAGTNLGTFANTTITEAGLRVSVAAGGTPDGGKAYAPFGMSDGSGKWYFEMTCVDPGSSNQRLCFGIANVTTNPNSTVITNAYIASASGAHGNYNIGAFTTNDVLQVAYDSTSNKLWFGKNNTWFNSGNPAAGTTPLVTVTSGITYVPFTHYASSGGGPGIGAWNFGQRPFTYTPPSGFNRLNTYNLPDSTIKKGNSYMDATLYTGNGSTQTITNAGGFRPDLVWQKSRSSGTAWHNLIDVVRGVGNRLFSNASDAQSFQADSLTAFNSNGFSIGATSDWNTNGSSNVAWQWQAGSSTVTNTSGTISSQVRANTTTGFSIVTYTGNGTGGATVGHGLGVAPKLIIAKSRSNADNWPVGTSALGWNQHLLLNNTNATAVTSSTWSDTAPTSTVFTVGTDNRINANTWTYVAYCWAEIAGFSKFGSYIGNGSADGPFVYLGFRPKYLLVRRSDAIENWVIYDTVRSNFNVADKTLQTNSSGSEGTNDVTKFDILSNGFKCRNSGFGNNTNGATHIYAAFAENPFKNSLAR